MKAFVDANLLIYLNVGSTDDILDLWISFLTRYDLYTGSRRGSTGCHGGTQ